MTARHCCSDDNSHDHLPFTQASNAGPPAMAFSTDRPCLVDKVIEERRLCLRSGTCRAKLALNVVALMFFDKIAGSAKLKGEP